MVITISRENGSGGKYIGELLSEKLGITMYDKELIREAAKRGRLDADLVAANDEVSSESYMEGATIFTKFFSGIALDDKIFDLESGIIRELADAGDCIIIGRCSNYILKDMDTLDVLVYAGDMEFKTERKEEYSHLSAAEAARRIREVDKKRATYYEYHTDSVWGRKEDFALCIDTSKLGVHLAADLIEKCYREKKNVQEGVCENAKK